MDELLDRNKREIEKQRKESDRKLKKKHWDEKIKI